MTAFASSYLAGIIARFSGAGVIEDCCEGAVCDVGDVFELSSSVATRMTKARNKIAKPMSVSLRTLMPSFFTGTEYLVAESG